MKKRLSLFPLILYCFITNTYAQSYFAEISVNAAPTPTVKCHLSGDSIFFSYKESSFIPDQTMWISGSGIKHDLDIPEVQDKLLAGITAEDNKKKYYFLETENKNQITSEWRIRMVEPSRGKENV